MRVWSELVIRTLCVFSLSLKPLVSWPCFHTQNPREVTLLRGTCRFNTSYFNPSKGSPNSRVL